MDLNQLTHWQQLAFCTALCERSFPNFELFCEIEHCQEQSEAARKMLNKSWEFLRGQLNSLKNIEKQLETMGEMIPNPDDFEHFGALPAMDVMVNLQSCLQSIIDSSILDAQAIQTMTQERLLEVLEMQEIPSQDSELWQRQLAFEADIYALITDKISHANCIKQLIPMSKDNGVSQLGICLNDD